MEDIGKRFGRDRSFCFDYLLIDEIIFDESDDITIYGKTQYFETYHTITLGITLDQLNTLLRSIQNYGEKVAEVIAEGMVLTPKGSTSLVIKDNFSFQLEMDNCILFTTLHRIDEDDIIWDDEEDENGKKEADKEDNKKDDEDIFAKLNRLRKERLERERNEQEMKEFTEQMNALNNEEDSGDEFGDGSESDDQDMENDFDDMFGLDGEFIDLDDDTTEFAFFVNEIYVLPPVS